jgi:hypothetical protein
MTTQVRFGLPVSGLLKDSSDDFLGTVLWRPSETTTCGKSDADFSLRTIGMCWKQQCLDRRPTFPGNGSVRFVTLDQSVAAADMKSILAVLGQVRHETSPTRRPPKGNLKKQVKEASHLSRETTELLRLWLADRACEAEESPVALLACCELLALYGSQFPAEVVGGLWRATLAGALTQSESFVEAAATEDWQDRVSGDVESRDTWLKAGLLSLTCGLLFDDVKGAPRLSRIGRASLNFQLLHVTDSAGTPVGEVFDALPEFLSLWSDGLLISRLFETTLWKSSATKRFDKMLRRLAAAVRTPGILTGTENGESAASLLRMAAAHHGVSPGSDEMVCLEPSVTSSRSTRSAASSKTTPSRKVKKLSKKAIPSWQSDDTDAACLRTSWAPDASMVTARFNSEPVKLDFVVEGVPIFSGPWQLELAEGGDILELEAAWECICWNSDSDVDYLELQLEFEGGPIIHRYVLLSRVQQFAIISDIISNSTPGRVDLATSLPLAHGVTLESSGNGREQILKAGDKTVRVFPLALPQDSGIGTAGHIGLNEVDDCSSLTLSHASESGTMFSPIVFDWAPERRSAPAEWRQLTVTRAGEIDTSGAASFRIQIGKLHLVLYRSLGGTERYRTFLGYQAESETVIGHFTNSGEIREILIVE